MTAVDQLNALLAGNVYALLMVFARVGTALMLMPGIGSTYTPARTRLLLALGFSICIAPIVRADLPAEPRDVPALFMAIGIEVVTGLFLGTISLIFMSVLETAGQTIAMQMGLSNAYIFNPQSQVQGSLPGTLLSMAAVVSVFATDLYQILIRGVVQSYRVFRYDNLGMFSDMSKVVVHLVSQSFAIAMELSAPFIAVGLMLYTVFGLIGRLMPQIQVFFVTLPLQIGLGCIILALSTSLMLEVWMTSFADTLRTLDLGM